MFLFFLYMYVCMYVYMHTRARVCEKGVAETFSGQPRTEWFFSTFYHTFGMVKNLRNIVSIVLSDKTNT